MLIDQEASIYQLTSNTSPTKIAQRNQAQKTKERAEGVTANQKQSNKYHSATTTTTETENPRSRCPPTVPTHKKIVLPYKD